MATVEKEYKVFVMYADNEAKYVGFTTKDVNKRLTEMMSQAKAVNTQFYHLAVSKFLREQYAACKHVGFTVVFTTKDKKEAMEHKSRLVAELGGENLLNDTPTFFKEIKEQK